MVSVAFYKKTAPLLLSLALSVLSMAAQAELLISDAWVRAVPPNASGTAAYFTLKNTGDSDVMVVSARAALAGSAEMHDFEVRDDGVKSMVHLHHLVVAAGAEVLFQSGGKHLMLMQLDSVPALGDSVQLCLITKAQAEVCTDAIVRHP
jgi:hypothetical protein